MAGSKKKSAEGSAQSTLDSFKVWLKKFEATETGKVVVSAVRAFVGVFIVAEAQIFNAVVNLVNSHDHAHWTVLASLAAALVAAGFTAAVRAVQSFFFKV